MRASPNKLFLKKVSRFLDLKITKLLALVMMILALCIALAWIGLTYYGSLHNAWLRSFVVNHVGTAINSPPPGGQLRVRWTIPKGLDCMLDYLVCYKNQDGTFRGCSPAYPIQSERKNSFGQVLVGNPRGKVRESYRDHGTFQVDGDGLAIQESMLPGESYLLVSQHTYYADCWEGDWLVAWLLRLGISPATVQAQQEVPFVVGRRPRHGA